MTTNSVSVRVSTIDLDVSIQCRATIDTATVTEYAERMTEGDTFPPITLYGTEKRSWIGDGWHRVMAGRQIDLVEIAAVLIPGGRIDGLKCALAANADHGMRRTNADKRRCVEIALREFSGLSSRAVAEMCGVSDKTVEAVRGPVAENPQCPPTTRTTKDGRQYPARRLAPAPPPSPAPVTTPDYATEEPPEPTGHYHPKPVLGPPRDGMQFARIAVMNLEEIRENDAERKQAFALVQSWLDTHRSKKREARP